MLSEVDQSAAASVGVEIERPLAGGVWGAYLGRTREGTDVVLKVLPRHHLAAVEKVQHAVALAERLRRSGYPAPQYLLVEDVAGRCVTVQEFVRGATPKIFEARHAEILVDLWRRHHSAAGDRTVEVDPLAAVRSEDSADCRELRNSDDPRIWEIYDQARAVIDRTAATLFRSSDIVHHDFHHRNFLADGDQVTAVIDWEGATAGDSRIDLCELAWASRPGSPTRSAEADELTSRAVTNEVDPAIAAAIAAGRAINKLAFGLRADEATLNAMLDSVIGYLQPLWSSTR